PPLADAHDPPADVDRHRDHVSRHLPRPLRAAARWCDQAGGGRRQRLQLVRAGSPDPGRPVRDGVRGLRLDRRTTLRRRRADAGHAHEPGGDAPGAIAPGRRDPPLPGAAHDRARDPVRPPHRHRRRRRDDGSAGPPRAGRGSAVLRRGIDPEERGRARVSDAASWILQSEDACAPLVQSLVMPLLLLSGILLPMALAPEWLRFLSNLKPLTHATDAARALFNSDWGNPEIAIGVAITSILAVIAVWIAARTFSRANA